MEGPSLVILAEELAPFKGRRPDLLGGNAKIDWQLLQNKILTDVKSWGKHLLMSFEGVWVRTHFLLFGSYRINDPKEQAPRLEMRFGDDEVAFYSCSVRILADGLAGYDWSIDTLSPFWDPAAALKKLQAAPRMVVCDALMDQSIFAGSGNIVKNEVLYQLRLHPDTRLGALRRAELQKLVTATTAYCKNFYKWKKNFELKKHWQVFRKSICPKCQTPVTRCTTGRGQRRSFFCERCQELRAA